MEWLSENWVLVLLFGGMAAMHLFGLGHGGHKDGKTSRSHSAYEKKTAASSDTKAASEDA
ncbi:MULTISPECIES: hypothetical protein [Rhodobacterales]|jgi:hypothetical protein|uniref:DUF2933 domain-containing protein n=2 Tax=Rhodobacterales TaxID=204455 RepID=A0A1H7SNF1_9RHOB|nr:MULTISPECIES: hypothetical protein [Rhodobacterales]PTX41278.1 hypothetical protein C8N44_13034 [Allosediminivita pacifica]SEL73636.1 hypothetical protein SAMN05443999_107176 [Roseovarius azorensis]